MPFVKYLLVSVPIVTISDCGFILASAGIFGSDWKYIWSGLSILIIIAVVGKLLTTKKNATDLFENNLDSSDILTVSQLTREIKGLLERNFPPLWIRGEISNLRIQPKWTLLFCS